MPRILQTLTLACFWAIVGFPAYAGTHVIGFYGWGDNILGSSRGIDQIAYQAKKIPGVTSVAVLNYWQTQQAADMMMSYPSGDKIVLYGYSCGANTITLF